MKKTIALLGMALALLGAVSAASAQEATLEATATVTFSESEINQTFWVTNPANRHLSDVYVDLQAENGGQVTISAFYTWRARSGGTNSANVAVVLASVVSNGRLAWNVVAITADGKPASQDIVTQVNTHLSATWRRWVGNHVRPGRLTDVSITDDDITFSFAAHV